MSMAILIAVWYFVGVSGFCYWWTQDNDLDSGDLLFSLFVGILGPSVWVIGWMIHAPKKTILKQRHRK